MTYDFSDLFFNLKGRLCFSFVFSFSPVFQAHLPACTRWWIIAFPFSLTTKKSAPFLQGILSLHSVGPLQPGRTVYIWGTSGPCRPPLLQASLGNRGYLSNMDHKLGGLKQHEFILTLLEARSLQSRIAGWNLLVAPREELFHASISAPTSTGSCPCVSVFTRPS